MKVTFKLLSGVAFLFEFPEDTTVGQMKDQVEKEKGYARQNTKLIFSGKILDNDNATIKDLGIQETNFIVVSVSKPKVQAPKKEEVPPVVPQPQPAVERQPAPAPAAVQPQPQPVAVPPPSQPVVAQQSPATESQAPAPAPAAVSDDNRFVMGEQYQSIMQNFIEMGFPREQIEKCMRAAFNNPDRAAEYLLSGIPPELEALANLPPRVAPPAAVATPPAATPLQGHPPPVPQLGSPPAPQHQPVPPQMGSQMGSIGNIIGLLPQFNQLRTAVQSNPELLQPLLQRIAQTNPQLFQLISQNPQEFIRLLNEPASQLPQQGPLGANLPNIGIGAPRPPPQQNQIFISPQEREAIERLMALGFDQASAAQAYFAFDKNEELAANFLLEGGGFDDDFGDGDDDEQEGPNPTNQ